MMGWGWYCNITHKSRSFNSIVSICYNCCAPYAQQSHVRQGCPSTICLLPATKSNLGAVLHGTNESSKSTRFLLLRPVLKHKALILDLRRHQRMLLSPVLQNDLRKPHRLEFASSLGGFLAVFDTPLTQTCLALFALISSLNVNDGYMPTQSICLAERGRFLAARPALFEPLIGPMEVKRRAKIRACTKGEKVRQQEAIHA